MSSKTKPIVGSVLSFVVSATIIAFATLVPFEVANAQSDEQRLAIKVVADAYSKVRESREVFSWEVAGPRDRIAHYCVNECLCLAKKFVPLLKQQGFDAQMIVLRPTKESMGIRIRHAKPMTFENSSYAYHVATAVRIRGDWQIIDPVVIGTTQLESLSIWKARIETPVTFH